MLSTLDCGVWKASGHYSGKSYLKWLINDVSLASIPLKIQVVLLALAQGKLNPGKVIQRKFPNMCLSPSWCVICKTSAETSNHLFLYCFVTSKLWSRLCKEANILCVISGSFHFILMENSYAFSKGKKAKTLWI